ncbi:hypothetical protein AL542_15545 [Grimontia hollisae]|uniref:hypothetical protein n=1 Tax=Grimontia hollisae TaxID=673 RepID=UPI00058E4CB3|nr:hypothetical protein [Grimontia hollisae]AMG31605.1 hypothetical protein AL542_15545 [Grimontia hollisae]STO45248.1 Uncharacterised protein [Grimontia hollisae]
MKRSEKWYFRLKHHCLAKEHLTKEQFESLTQLSDEEVDAFFQQSSRHIKKRMSCLGKVVRYQNAKKAEISHEWPTLRQELGQKLCLWSDALGIKPVKGHADDVTLGLAMLANTDRKKAMIWSIRLKKALPDFLIEVKSVPRLQQLLLQINKD